MDIDATHAYAFMKFKVFGQLSIADLSTLEIEAMNRDDLEIGLDALGELEIWSRLPASYPISDMMIYKIKLASEILGYSLQPEDINNAKVFSHLSFELNEILISSNKWLTRVMGEYLESPDLELSKSILGSRLKEARNIFEYENLKGFVSLQNSIK